MTSAIRGAPRSSARLIKKLEDQICNIDDLLHNDRIAENPKPPIIKNSPDTNIGSKPKRSGSKERNVTISSGTKTAVRTTTSRRGGRSGISHSPRAALKRSQIDNQNRTTSRPPQGLNNIEKLKEVKKEMPHATGSTPSSAAAAAAAAAKALCVDQYRQNVFRPREEESKLRITTRSTNGLKKTKSSFGKSTMRVMGSHTPTHIPRHINGRASYDRSRHEPSRPSHFSPRGNTPASVFRERSTTGQDSGRHLDEIECSPQEMLLSLKSGSFDLISPGGAPKQALPSSSQPKGSKKDDNVLLSPEAPPRIQHSHHEGMKSEPLFFNPRTPKTPKTPNASHVKSAEALQGTPSFSLFDKSFDSFGDGGYLRSPNAGSTGFMDQALPSTFSLAPSYDEFSPKKKMSMASPNSNFRFTFSPNKQRSHDLDELPVGSPAISIDTVEAIDAPLMPRTPKIPITEPLLSSNVMVLEPSKTIRNIPAPLDSKKVHQKQSSTIPNNKRPFPAQGPLRHGMAPSFRSRPTETDQRRRIVPPTVCRKNNNPPPGLHPALRHPNRPPEHRPVRSGPVHNFGSYGRGHSPQLYGGRPTGVFMPDKKDTSLSPLDADQIYKRLSRHMHAFQKCSHLLPGFKRVMLSSSDNSLVPVKSETSAVASVSPERVDGEKETNENAVPSCVDKEKERSDHTIARRRIVSAICAFGGNCSGSRSLQKDNHYKSDICARYFEHQNRISWDVEEDPPVKNMSVPQNSRGSTPMKRKDEIYDLNLKTPKKIKSEISRDAFEISTEDTSKPTPSCNEAPKMRYRCKLCGQPKQNHKCPFQKSLQRSIGITVHAAVNSFTAAEPGDLAPALSEMNNFVPVGDGLPEITPSRPKRAPIAPLFRRQPVSLHSTPHVTPEAMRSINQARKAAGYPLSVQRQYDHFAMAGRMMPPTPLSNIRRRRILSPEKKASALAMPNHLSDLIFVDSIPLKAEQFRYVSTKSQSSFQYPSIPLPYPQRKALSDNLFELSHELPSLKEDCAIILRKARETNVWDIAVAELLAQLIVAIHCPAEDTRLEGLSRYLSSLGFAC